MANSIIREISCTPHIFKKEYLFENSKRYDKLKELLNDVYERALIIVPSNPLKKEWRDFVDKQVQEYNINERKEITSILDRMYDEEKIVFYPKYEGDIEDERSWIEQIEEIDKIRKLDLILATKKKKTILNGSTKLLKQETTRIFKQTKKRYEEVISLALGYTKDVKIIDPYFSLFPEKKDRYSIPLELICENLGKKHEIKQGIKDDTTIDIYTSSKSTKRKRKIDEKDSKKSKYEQYCDYSLSGWKEIIEKLEKQNDYKIKIRIHIYEGLSDNKWHDRYLITKQYCIYVGKGHDIDDNTNSTWGLIGRKEYEDNVEKNFKPVGDMIDCDDKPYIYTAEVTSSGVDLKVNKTKLEEILNTKNIVYE